MALLDHLRANYSSEFSSSSESPDLIDFFMELEFLQSHQHICYLFKLSCMCLTSVSPQYPPVFMGKIDTRGLRSRVADVVLPCQSYLLAVPDSLAVCCTESNLGKFSQLSASFGQSGFAADYDPWSYVDEFGRSALYKALLASHRSVLSGSEAYIRSPTFADTPSMSDAPAVRLPSENKRRRMNRSSSRSRTSSVIEESSAGCSKN